MADPAKFGYQKLEIYRRAHELGVRVDKMTLASADETREHLRYLQDTGSLRVVGECSVLAAECERLSASIGRFMVGVEREQSRPFYLRADSTSAGPSGRAENPESRIENGPRGPGR
jgi:hypothetical protein